MEKKNRRYEIQSRVHVPDMDEIELAASDFSEHTEIRDRFRKNPASDLTGQASVFSSLQLKSMKTEMEMLANAVAQEEKEGDAPDFQEEEAQVTANKEEECILSSETQREEPLTSADIDEADIIEACDVLE